MGRWSGWFHTLSLCCCRLRINPVFLFREAHHFRDWKIVHPNKEALGSLPPLLPLHEHISLAPSTPTLSSGQLPDHKMMSVSVYCTCWCRGGAHPARLSLLGPTCTLAFPTHYSCPCQPIMASRPFCLTQPLTVSPTAPWLSDILLHISLCTYLLEL